MDGIIEYIIIEWLVESWDKQISQYLSDRFPSVGFESKQNILDKRLDSWFKTFTTCKA